MSPGAPARWDVMLKKAKADTGGSNEAKQESTSWLPQLQLSKPAGSCWVKSGADRFRFETDINPTNWSTKPTTFYFASESLTYAQADDMKVAPHAGENLFSNPFDAIRAASSKACDGTLLVVSASDGATSVQTDSTDFPNISFPSPPPIEMAIRCSDSCSVWRLIKDVGRSFDNGELNEADAVLLLNDILLRFENDLQPGITLATSQTHQSIKEAAVRSAFYALQHWPSHISLRLPPTAQAPRPLHEGKHFGR